MTRVVSGRAATLFPLQIETSASPVSGTPRLKILNAFLETVHARDYSFDHVWNIFWEKEELRTAITPILLALTLHEFDALIERAQAIFKDEMLAIEKARCSFLIYQLAETCQDMAYVPFQGDLTSVAVQGPAIQPFFDDTLSFYFSSQQLEESPCI